MNLPTTLRNEVSRQTVQPASPRVSSPRPTPPPRAESPDAFHLYLREISPLPRLTLEEEVALATRIQQGDDDARETMIKANLRLVVRIARDYEMMGVPLLDLIAEGNIGLMTAVEKFDPSRGAKFSTYAGFWIKQSVRRALGNQSRTIRVPINIHGKLFGLERVTRHLHQMLGRAPTEMELAQEAGLSPAQLAKLRLATLRPSSLDTPLENDEDSTLAELLPDEGAGTPYEKLASDTLRELLQEFLGDLTTREAYVLRLRFGLEGGEELTLEEVGKRVQLTRERVRKIQLAALAKLRHWITRRETTSALGLTSAP